VPCSPARPNPSLEPTSSGTARKPAVRLLEHLHTSGLRAAPPVSSQLERYTSVESPLSANASRGRRRELPLSSDRPNRMRLRQFPVHAATVGLRPNASSMKAVRACVSLGVFSHRGRGAVREQSHLPSAGQESLARIISLTHNPSLVRTHSGMPRKPAVLYSNHRRTSGLRGTPTRSAQLER